jgi:hypothetical protein
MNSQHRSHLIDAHKRELSLPFSATRVLASSLVTLRTAVGERAWSLAPTTVESEVARYAAEHVRESAMGPVPELKAVIDLEAAESTALRLTAGIEFLEMARTASPGVSPMVRYYGAAHVTAALSRAFLEWSSDNRNHGLEASHRDPIGNTVLTIKPKGHFRRLVAASFLLNGGPSIFDDLVSFAGQPVANMGPGEALEHFQATNRGAFPSSLTLDGLLRLNLVDLVENLRQSLGLHKWHRLPETLFLYDFLVLFLASSVARYNVIGWREILEGRTNAYRNAFDASFSRIDQFMLPHVVETLYSPSPFWNQRPTSGGPYSNWEIAQSLLA